MPRGSKTLLVVEGDHNDADYIVRVTPITPKQLVKFKPLFKNIKKFKKYNTTIKSESSGFVHTWEHNHNWPVGEYGHRPDLGEKSITELYGDLAEEFDSLFVPHEDGNIHTIERIYLVDKGKDIL